MGKIKMKSTCKQTIKARARKDWQDHIPRIEFEVRSGKGPWKWVATIKENGTVDPGEGLGHYCSVPIEELTDM